MRKLRANAMPPAGAPRPDAATYASLTAHIESELDGAADARPQVGGVPLVHRLSRTEYPDAIRNLLALESLPREVSIDYLLPPDNISSGFDNIADLLFGVRRARWSAIWTPRGSQPSRCWQSVDASAREHLSSRPRASAGRASGRTALRNPRRSRGAEQLSGGCHVHREGGNPGSLSASFPSPVPPREHGARHWRLAVRTSGSSMSPAMALFLRLQMVAPGFTGRAK